MIKRRRNGERAKREREGEGADYTFKVVSFWLSGDLIRFGSPAKSAMYFIFKKRN